MIDCEILKNPKQQQEAEWLMPCFEVFEGRVIDRETVYALQRTLKSALGNRKKKFYDGHTERAVDVFADILNPNASLSPHELLERLAEMAYGFDSIKAREAQNG
jgi:hypothetical protein